MSLQKFIKKTGYTTCTMSIYIFHWWCILLMILIIFDTNSDLYGMNTRVKYQLRRPTVNLSCIEQDVLCSSIKIFNNLPPFILKLKQKEPKLKLAWREYLIAHTLYSIDQFLSTIQITFPLQLQQFHQQ